MSKLLIDEWSAIRKWWSMWAGVIVAVVLTGIPIIADQWPQLAPTFVSLFPKHGEQWAPVIGVLLMIIARLLNQAAVLDGFRRLFRRDKDAQP
ncbi:hypothetical protein [Ralstonia insidiosa]|uniref:DUF7940 domain-containing protein n=1 Tax=Ralstonia insidiosa TaxID=190721 RepID=UPI001427E7A0|nr:hypothetical protein [Ralstonia insidiosa]